MLAPLEDRRCLEREVAADSPAEEIEDLRRALRESRRRLRRGAWESTRQIMLLNGEIARLQARCEDYRNQVVRHESGVAIVELGRELMRLVENNERLKGTAHRMWTLEKKLAAAHAECRRLAQERDELADALYSLRQSRAGD